MTFKDHLFIRNNNYQVLKTSINKQLIQKIGGFNDNYYAKDEEINAKSQEEAKLQLNLMNLQQEKFKLENGDYSVDYPVIEAKKYMIFYYIAAGVFGLLSLIALIFFLATRRK